MRLLSSARSLRRCAGQCATQRGGERITAAPCVMRNSRILVAPPGATGQRGNEKGAGGRPPPNGATRRIRTRRGTRWPRSPPSAWPASIQLPSPRLPRARLAQDSDKTTLATQPHGPAARRIPAPASRIPPRPSAGVRLAATRCAPFLLSPFLSAGLPAGRCVVLFSAGAPDGSSLFSSQSRPFGEITASRTPRLACRNTLPVVACAVPALCLQGGTLWCWCCSHPLLPPRTAAVWQCSLCHPPSAGPSCRTNSTSLQRNKDTLVENRNTPKQSNTSSFVHHRVYFFQRVVSSKLRRRTQTSTLRPNTPFARTPPTSARAPLHS